jgi:hypothetical protein
MPSLLSEEARRGHSGLSGDRAPISCSHPSECSWKDTCPTANARCALSGAEGQSCQLLDGWHQDDAGRSLWSMRNAVMVLRNPGSRSRLSLYGLLPPSVSHGQNTLRIECDGNLLGLVRNCTNKGLKFRFSRMLPPSSNDLVHVKLSVDELYCPSEAESGLDRRGLGFALFHVSVIRLGMLRWVKAILADALSEWESNIGEWLFTSLPDWIEASGRRFSTRRLAFQKTIPAYHSTLAPGLSIVVTDMEEDGALDACLSGIESAVKELEYPVEVIVVSRRSPETAFASFPSNILRRWIRMKCAGVRSRAFRAAVNSASHEWVYVLSSRYILNESTLPEAMKWRGPHVFAVSSALPAQRTGWMGMRLRHGLVEPEDRSLDSKTFARGALCVNPGASLYNRRLLRTIWGRKDTYGSSAWENLEWSVRAWKNGFETVYCPTSCLADSGTKSDPNPSYSETDALRFLFRNALPQAADLRTLVAKALGGGIKTRAGLLTPWYVLTHYAARWKESAYPFKALPLDQVNDAYYVHPFCEQSKPGLIFVSPFAIFPPSHGSAVGMMHLLGALKRFYSVHILSDESAAYGPESPAFFSGFATVRLLSGRREDPERPRQRIARIESHSHPALKESLRMLVSVYKPRFVEIEHVELAKLIEAREDSSSVWILNLHDVLLSDEEPGASAEDRYELDLIDRFDSLICCSAEDASLLGRSNTTIVPTAVDLTDSIYEPSPATPRILFIGPSRASQNIAGIREFIGRVYSLLLPEFADLELWILGGKGAAELVRSCSDFRQRGIQLFEYVDSVQALLRQCALTINPIVGNRGSCRKVAESLAAGRVCISTREGARGYLAFGFPSLLTCESVEGFAAPLRKLLRDVTYRRSLERLREEQRYALSLEYSQQKLLGLYSKLEREMGYNRFDERS